jgi:hypothetical protein
MYRENLRMSPSLMRVTLARRRGRRMQLSAPPLHERVVPAVRGHPQPGEQRRLEPPDAICRLSRRGWEC